MEQENGRKLKEKKKSVKTKANLICIPIAFCDTNWCTYVPYVATRSVSGSEILFPY